MIPNPWLILGALAAASFIAVSGWIGGAHHEAEQDQLRRDAELQAAHERYVADDKRLQAVAGDLEAARAARKASHDQNVRIVERLVDRPVYRADCLDDDGLRLANAALAGSAADPGVAAPAVPASAAAGGQDGR